MQKEREIDLLDLIYYVLSKWKKLILAGLIGLILVGGYKYYSAEQTRRVYMQDREAYKAADKSLLEKKEELLELKGERAAIEQQLENTALTAKERELAKEKVSQLQNYLSESVLMRINAGAAPKKVKTFLVSTDEALSAYGTDIVLDDSTAAKYSVPTKYINELISVEIDENANTVKVTAYGDSLDMAENLSADACAVLEGRKKDITDRYGRHEIKLVAETCGESVDAQLAARQSLRYDELNSYIVQAKGEVAYLEKDNDTIVTAGTAEDLNSALEVLNAKVEAAESNLKNAEELTQRKSIDKGVRYGVLGGILFALLLAAVYFLVYVFDGRLHTVKELGYCFDMPLLAGLNAPLKKGCKLDRFFHRLRNKGAGTSNEVLLQTASVTVGKLVDDCRTVAVLSSLDEQTLEPITSGLSKFIPGVQFVPVAESNQTVEAAEKLKASDAVIVFEKREASRIREIEAELHRARLLEKNIIGCIGM